MAQKNDPAQSIFSRSTITPCPDTMEPSSPKDVSGKGTRFPARPHFQLSHFSSSDLPNKSSDHLPTVLDNPSGWIRLRKAIERRGRAGWRGIKNRLGGEVPSLAAEQVAMDRLEESAYSNRFGNAFNSSRSCPGLAGAELECLARLGSDTALRYAAESLSAFFLDGVGAFPNSLRSEPSLINTALASNGLCEALQALARIGQMLPYRIEQVAMESLRFLEQRLDARGRINWSGASGGAFDSRLAEGMDLLILAALYRGGQWFQVSAWQEKAQAGVTRWLKEHCAAKWDYSSHLLGIIGRALLDLEQPDEVGKLLSISSAIQNRDGSLPAWPGERWISTAGVAAVAGCWFRLGWIEPGNRALAWLRRCQRSDGSFPLANGIRAGNLSRRESPWTVVEFLSAVEEQVAASFCTVRTDLPDVVDSNDTRLEAARKLARCLNPGERFLDVGCGSGRFLQKLAEEFPALEFTGVDSSAQLRGGFPKNVKFIVGGLPRIPACDGCFAAAMAIESLEHTVACRQGVEEICRVVRPGGRVLIVDKNRRYQAMCDHEPWEQWFEEDQLGGWLSPYCRQWTVESLPCGNRREPEGYFLCWNGERAE